MPIQTTHRNLGFIYMLALCLQFLPVHAPASPAKTAPSFEKAVFSERSPQTVRGASSTQDVVFSATRVTGKIQVSFVLNNKEFLLVYESISLNAKQLNSLQLIPDTAGHNRKTKDDEQILSALYKTLQNDLNQLEPLEAGILSSLDFLLNMVPRNEPFTKIDLQRARATRLIQPEAFSNICTQRGKLKTGTFDDFLGKNYTQQKIAGNPASACLGRCGTKCVQDLQEKKRQYTNECFVHDLCAGFFGTTLGNCTDEFNAAADGYLNAPNCGFYVIGKWKNQYDWNCDGSSVAATVTHFSNNRFSTSEGFAGSWSLTGNKLVRTFDNGTKHSGTLAATNMKTTGNMTDTLGHTGCFTDTYLTTQTQ